MAGLRPGSLFCWTRRLAGLVALVLMLAGCGSGGGSTSVTTPAPAPTSDAPVASKAKWTVMVYMNGANDLEDKVPVNVNQMEMAPASDDVHIVVQCKTLQTTVIPTDGGSKSAKRFQVVHDDDPDKVTSPVLEDRGNADMDDPNELTGFVQWADQNFPAEHHVLILWSHAASFTGFGGDKTSGDKGISLADTRKALETIKQSTTISKWDIIGWDACLMASLEVDLALAPYGSYVVASEEESPSLSWSFDGFLIPLVNNPAQGPVELGKSMIDTTVAMWIKEDRPDVTMSLVDLSAVAELAAQVNNLGEAMGGSIPQALKDVLLPQRARSMIFGAKKAIETGDYVDIGNLCTNLGGDSYLFPYTNAVMKALGNGTGDTGQGAVVYSRTGPEKTGATGLQVYFPTTNDLSPLFSTTDLAGPAGWGTFLNAFNAALQPLKAEVPVVTINSASGNASVANPAAITFTPSPVAIGLRDQTVEIGQKIAATDFALIIGVFDLSRQQPTRYTTTWDSRVLMLSDGTREVALGARPEKPGSENWQADVKYRRAGSTDEEEGAVLYLSLEADGTVKLKGVATYSNGNLSSKVEPLDAGDEIAPNYTKVDLVDKSTDYQRATVTLTVPASKVLTPSFKAVANGTYAVMVWAQSMVETRGFTSRDITVP